jgi:hypothetical protein
VTQRRAILLAALFGLLIVAAPAIVFILTYPPLRGFLMEPINQQGTNPDLERAWDCGPHNIDGVMLCYASPVGEAWCNWNMSQCHPAGGDDGAYCPYAGPRFGC